MCCEICPYYKDCEDLGKIRQACCPDCPDYGECLGSEVESEGEDSLEDDDLS